VATLPRLVREMTNAYRILAIKRAWKTHWEAVETIHLHLYGSVVACCVNMVGSR
jgi:hypothetical protein